MRCLILFFIFLFCAFDIASQNSFQISVEHEDALRLMDLKINDNEQLFYLKQGPSFVSNKYIEVIEVPDIIDSYLQGIRITSSDSTCNIVSIFLEVDTCGYVLPIISNDPMCSSFIVYYNFSNQTFLAKKSPSNSQQRVSLSNNSIYVSNTNLVNLDVYKLNASGDHLFSFKYGLQNHQISLVDIAPQDQNVIFLTTAKVDEISKEKRLLLQLDSEGTVLSHLLLNDTLCQFNQVIVDSENHIFLGGAITNNFSNNYRNLVVTKLSPELIPIWTRVYHAPYFSFRRSILNIDQNNELLIGYSTDGSYPVVLIRADGDGNILSQKGYPLYEPRVVTYKSGGVAMASQFLFDDGGDLENQIIIARSDSLGNIDDCVDFETCILSQSISIPISEGSIISQSIDFLEDANVNIQPITVPITPFCDIPPAPNAYFTFPDTLCLGESATTDSVYNQLAHGIEWQLTGPGADSFLVDSTHFSYQFTAPGTYILTQTIYLLGCGYYHEEEITILPDLVLDTSETDTICEPSSLLIPTANRPLQSWMWEDGSMDALSVMESGSYAVTITDGYCTAPDTVDVYFLKDFADINNPFTLPMDTAICSIHLPYFLQPTTVYDGIFTINGLPFTPPIEISEAGIYNIDFVINGCTFSQSFALQIDPCTSEIYLPNIFSPNNDGINDFFTAYGDDFEITTIRIYDRWGGLIYQGNNADARWDGQSGGKPAPTGVYLYQVQYRNTRTGEENQVTGDLTVLR